MPPAAARQQSTGDNWLLLSRATGCTYRKYNSKLNHFLSYLYLDRRIGSTSGYEPVIYHLSTSIRSEILQFYQKWLIKPPLRVQIQLVIHLIKVFWWWVNLLSVQHRATRASTKNETNDGIFQEENIGQFKKFQVKIFQILSKFKTIWKTNIIRLDIDGKQLRTANPKSMHPVPFAR